METAQNPESTLATVQNAQSQAATPEPAQQTLQTPEYFPGFMRPKDACKYLRIGRTKLNDLAETDPDFPRKIRISTRCVGWTRGQLDEWLARKAQEVRA